MKPSRALTLSLLAMTVLFKGAAIAQNKAAHYITTRESTLSAAAEAVTIQLAANATKNIQLQEVQVWCSTGSVEFWFERDGSAASSTSLAIAKVNPNANWVPTATATAWHTSNSTGGTQVGPRQVCYGGSNGVVLGMSRFILEAGAGTVRNITVRTASYTGTIRIAITHEERDKL